MEKKMRFGIKSKIIIGYLIVIVCLFIAFIVLNSQISSLQKSEILSLIMILKSMI